MTARSAISAQLSSTRRKVLNKTTVQEVRLGDGNGQADAPEKGYHWARLPLGADENGNAVFGPKFRVRANPDISYFADDGRRVFIHKRNGQWWIAGSSLDDLEQAGIDTRSLNPNDRYRFFRYLDEIVNLNAYALKVGLKVSVRELIYEVPGTPRIIKIWRGTDATSHVDLADNDFIGASSSQTSIVPTTVDTHRYALLVFSHTRYMASLPPLQVYPGVAISLFTDLGEADLQTCYDDLPDDELLFAIKAYYVEYGQSTIAGVSKDVDVRQFINVPVSGGSDAPFVDTTALVKGSADATKLLRFEVDGFTTDTTRVLTPPDYDGVIATLSGAETLANKVLSQLHLLLGGFKGIFTHSNTADRTYTLPNYNATLSPGTTKGDVIAHDGTDNVRVPVGADYQYIVADSTTASGLNYARGSLDVPGDTAESWAAKDLLYLVDGTSNTWAKIDTDAVPPKISDTRGVALTAASHPSSNNPIRREGIVSGFTGLTPGAKIYADTTAGGYTQTKPTVSVGSGQICLVEIGYAIDATSAFIDKDTPIEYFKREWLSDAETVSITHHADPEGQSRIPDAYLTLNTEVVIDQYADSDTDAPLKRRSTGSTVTVDAAGANLTTLGDVGGTDFRLAQQFEVTTTGYVSQIVVRAGTSSGSPTVFPSYRIEGNDALLTIPNGNVVTNSSGTLSAWTASADNPIAYTTMPYLVAGQKYWFILELSAFQATNVAFGVIRNTAGGYANGVMKWDSTTTGTWPNTWAGGGGTNEMRMSITTVVVNDRLAQSISFGSTEDLTRIELYLKRTGTFTSEVLNVELYLASGAGNPIGGPIYTSEDVLASSVGLSAGYVSFDFATPSSTIFGNDWAIVLKTTATASATNYIDWLVDTSSPGFTGVFQTLRNTTWADFSPAADGRFIVYGVGTYYEERIVVGLGSTVMEAHSGDTSYANQDTITTFENVYGVLVDATVKVRMG